MSTSLRVPRQALLDALRAFSIAGRELSFKAAADALFLTPSAISHRIRDLEEHLGQPVFVRKTRAVELTDAGRALLDEIETSIDRERRQALWFRLQRIYADELPAIPLFFRADPHVVPKWLAGYTPTGHSDLSPLYAEQWRSK